MGWAKLVAKHIDSKIRDLLVRILYGILFTVVPSRKMAATVLSIGSDQFRIAMQERAKEMPDTELNDFIEGLNDHQLWPGKSEGYRKELEKVGLLSIALKAFQNEKFLREYNSNKGK